MSHIVQIQTQVRDPVAVATACRRLGLAAPVQRTVRLFNASATGLAVELPGWKYPVVCELPTGTLRYDHYNGAWGDQKHLDAFLQRYAVEKARLEARKKGYHVNEQTLPSGEVKLTIRVEGGAP